MTTIDIGFKGEARSNPLYASRLFLKKMGIPAERVDIYRLRNLPSKKTVIIINTHRSTLVEHQIDELMDWVESGGHLITVIIPERDIEEEGDLLQTHLSIEAKDRRYLKSEFSEKQDKQLEKDKKAGKKKKSDDKEEFDPIVKVSLNGLKKTYDLEFNSIDPINIYEDMALESDENVMVKGAVYLLHRHYGKGMVSVASDLDIIENKMIGNEDHAEFFWQLIHKKTQYT